jgi:hypothetical protein
MGKKDEGGGKPGVGFFATLVVCALVAMVVLPKLLRVIGIIH